MVGGMIKVTVTIYELAPINRGCAPLVRVQGRKVTVTFHGDYSCGFCTSRDANALARSTCTMPEFSLVPQYHLSLTRVNSTL